MSTVETTTQAARHGAEEKKYLINTLGWRWARRELSEQPQKEHVEHRIERQKWQRAKMAFEQGARVAVGSRLFTLARRGAIGGPSGSRPPRSPYVGVLPKVAVGGWRWGKWWEMSKGTRGTMTGAHLGGRGAGRRCSCSATGPPPAKAPGVAAMLMGATTNGRSAFFFRNFCPRTWHVICYVFLCSWTRPNLSKAALTDDGADQLAMENLACHRPRSTM